MPKALGIVKILIDGSLLHSKPGATLDPGGIVRTTIESDQPGYFAESRKAAKIECDLVVDKNFSAESLRSADDFTATFEAATGQVWVVNHAYVVDPPVITAGTNGGAKLVIEGPPAQEMK